MCQNLKRDPIFLSKGNILFLKNSNELFFCTTKRLRSDNVFFLTPEVYIMMLRIAAFLLLPLQCLFGSIVENEEELYCEAPAPEWVVPVEYSRPFEIDGLHLQFLLFELQDNWLEHTEFCRTAVQAMTQTGIEAIAQLELDFDPNYEKLVVHEIKICRDGKWIDQRHARRELLHREEGLEDNLFHGDFTLVYFLEDVRPGDIVEYSYSTVGEHPLFCSHYYSKHPLETSFWVNKLSYRLVTYPEHQFAIRTFKTSIEPKVRDLSDSVREWLWVVNDPDVSDVEDFQPGWFQPAAYIELSEYENWGAVVNKIAPLYTLPENFESEIPDEMAETIAGWKGSPKERALAAVRFVQDEVRYLGFEEGIMGHKPHDPRAIFQQRFGDCKDKTFLLHSLLHLMGISSTPTLVDTDEGRLIAEMLPSPNAFNHVILQISIDGEEYWVDSTISLQGGSLESNFFPNYYWGLRLAVGTETLTPLPEYKLGRPTEIEKHIKVISESQAEMTITWTAYGAKADGYRQYVDRIGLANISDESLESLQRKYGKASTRSPMKVTDDRESNVFVLKESYTYSLRKGGDKNKFSVSSIVIRNFLDYDFNPNRSTPYSLIYPLWVKEHIRVDNPFSNWQAEQDENDYADSSVSYHYRFEGGGQGADLYHELKHLSDHVKAEKIQEYWDAVHEIEHYGSLEFKLK
jgi:hypothetical protein